MMVIKKERKVAVEASSSSYLWLGEEARVRFRHKSLLQDYEELLQTAARDLSGVVTKYLLNRLQNYLNQQGFHIVGYGCTTCIGNSEDFDESVAAAISENDIIAAAVSLMCQISVMSLLRCARFLGCHLNVLEITVLKCLQRDGGTQVLVLSEDVVGQYTFHHPSNFQGLEKQVLTCFQMFLLFTVC